MARFITIVSTGAGLAGGNILLNVDDILTVRAATATTTQIIGAATVTTVTHTTVGTVPSVRDAINSALTANPGGVNARVALPAGITVSAIVVV
tara:strand:+ start:84 stop:362 length:279 start_codon:yes stop_codon:yes gene_type:complete